jgi:2-methylcitrate dehydratase PrpD
MEAASLGGTIARIVGNIEPGHRAIRCGKLQPGKYDIVMPLMRTVVQRRLMGRPRRQGGLGRRSARVSDDMNPGQRLDERLDIVQTESTPIHAGTKHMTQVEMSYDALSKAAMADGPRETVPLLAELGRFVASTDLSVIPADAWHQAKLCILDTIGCMVLGAQTPDVEPILAAERAASDRHEAHVYGSRIRLSAAAAARVNGYLGDIFELNDLIGAHASIASVTTGLAVAEAEGCSGAQLLKAVICGIETTSRIHAAFRTDLKPYPDIGNAYVGFINTLGSAAVAASLLDLNALETSEALAVAGALAGWCPAEAIFRDGGTVKPLLFGGWPASVGILGARYAQRGLSGPGRLLEGELGFFRAVALRFDAEAIRSPGKWFVAEPRRKIHACCGYIHPAIDLVVKLRQEKGKEIFRGTEIRIAMNPTIIPAVAKGRPPATPNEARFHAGYCVALAAAGADIVLPTHSTAYAEFLADPAIREFMNSVRTVSQPAFKHYQECAVELVAADGTVVAHASGSTPKGSPGNPLSDEEVVAKFRRSTSGQVIGGPATEAYVARVLSLESETTCRWLATSLV